MSSAPATLYIPVHKRSTTPTSEHESSPESHLPIYSIQDLLKLSKSPLAVISAEHRDHIKETVPEISISRRQRKAIEHRQLIKEHARAARAKELSSALPNPKATTVQISDVCLARDGFRTGGGMGRSWMTSAQAGISPKRFTGPFPTCTRRCCCSPLPRLERL
ncbi:hypothetical protein D9757_004182 [Collybiopsis confluens]|uniref:Uncharacterized protein n=1 Tax=Collybiopsis confluens TaxID=2823264 RepID=A0A8H5HU79_9AGAR|nr:hypothetical protein D9757_004182 [Collybiopsis confluens]